METAAATEQPKTNMTGKAFFVVDRKIGRHAIGLMKSVINSNTVLPILEDIHISISKTGVVFSATDLEASVVQELEVIEYGGQLPEHGICVNANQLAWVFNKAASDNIRIEFVPNPKVVSEPTCVITSGRNIIKLPTESGSNYPKIPKVEGEGVIIFTDNTFTTMLGKALPYTSNDDLRPSMTTVCVQSYKSQLTIVATDAHRLFHIGIDREVPKEFPSLLLPKKFARIASAYFNDGTFRYDAKFASLEAEGVTLLVRLVDFKFPDWPVVLPTDDVVKFTVDRKEFISQLELIKGFANKSTSQVKVTVKKTGLELKAADLDFSMESSGSIKSEVTGLESEFTFAINARFVLESLKTFPKNKAAVFTNSGNPTKAFMLDAHILIMPLMLNE